MRFEGDPRVEAVTEYVRYHWDEGRRSAKVHARGILAAVDASTPEERFNGLTEAEVRATLSASEGMAVLPRDEDAPAREKVKAAIHDAYFDTVTPGNWEDRAADAAIAAMAGGHGVSA